LDSVIFNIFHRILVSSGISLDQSQGDTERQAKTGSGRGGGMNGTAKFYGYRVCLDINAANFIRLDLVTLASCQGGIY